MSRNKHSLISLGIFMLALLPRVFSGRFVTIDEAYHWFDRVDRFGRALATGNYAGTNLIGHPGVTTMWLGMFGDMLFHWAAGLGLLAGNDGAASRALIRMPLALVAALCVALAYSLLRRLFDDRMALLATLLWASEPFLVAHAQLLHLDSLLTSFMTLCLLFLIEAGVRGRGSGVGDAGETPDTRHETTDTTVQTQNIASLRIQHPSSVQTQNIASLRIQHPSSVQTQNIASLRIRHPSSFILSAVFASLALLTKSPAVLLLPIAALVRGLQAWRSAGLAGLPRAALRFGLWFGLLMLIWIALWPAAWLDLPGALGRVLLQAEADGGSPHGWGNYFLGQAVADPGPGFYLVAVPLRLAPWTFLGLLVTALIGFKKLLMCWQEARSSAEKDYIQTQSIGTTDKADFRNRNYRNLGVLASGRLGAVQTASQQHYALLLLAVFVLLFTAMMSIPPKKFDRYLLPIFPSLDILAAYGLLRAAAFLKRPLAYASREAAQLKSAQKGRSGMLHLALKGLFLYKPAEPLKPSFIEQAQSGSFWPRAGWLVWIGMLIANLLFYHPYELAFYNPLLGGAKTALASIPVGWGEGYELAADYIRAQPNAADRPVAALYEPALDPFVPVGAAPMAWALEPDKVDYAVVYIDQIQRRYKAELFEALRQNLHPLHTITVHGIPYAEVYAIPPAIEQAREARFGEAIKLRGFSLDSTQLHTNNVITLTLAWESLAQPDQDYNLFVHVFDQHNQRVAQVDVPAGEPRWPTSAWTAGHYIRQLQRIPMPANLPPGRYRVVIGLYDPHNFQRLTLHPPTDRDPMDGNDALILGEFE